MASSFYSKNVPPWERALRIAVSALGVVLGFVFLAAPWSIVVAASCIGFALTGLFGYCPACAMVGRRI